METWHLILSLVIAAATIIGAIFAIIKSAFGKVADWNNCVNRLDNIESRLAKLDEINKYYSERLVKIETILSIKHRGLESIFSQKHSPRVLNTLGLQIFNDMNGQSFLLKNKDKLFEEIDNRNPHAALDVETFAGVALAMSVNEEWFIPIKSFVYNCPTIKTEGGNEIDITIETACYVMSLPLRDMYLEAHPELPR